MALIINSHGAYSKCLNCLSVERIAGIDELRRMDLYELRRRFNATRVFSTVWRYGKRAEG
jgi:hypothetical protein